MLAACLLRVIVNAPSARGDAVAVMARSVRAVSFEISVPDFLLELEEAVFVLGVLLFGFHLLLS